MTIASTLVVAVDGDVVVLADDLSTERDPDVVHLSLVSGHTRLLVAGELDVVQRLIVQADNELNRVRAGRQDAERNGHIAAELRELSGEHEAIDPQEGGQ